GIQDYALRNGIGPQVPTTPKTDRLPPQLRTVSLADFAAPDGKSGGGKGGRSKAASEAEREAAAVRDLIADLEHERSLIGMTDVEREKANALRQAGAAATDEQRAKIGSLIEAI